MYVHTDPPKRHALEPYVAPTCVQAHKRRYNTTVWRPHTAVMMIYRHNRDVAGATLLRRMPAGVQPWR